MVYKPMEVQKMNVFKSEIEDGISEQVAKANSIAFTSTISVKELPQEALEKALAMQFQPITQIDLFYYESILVSTGWNKNDDVFDIREVVKARNTPSNKPVNYMHNEKDIIGHMTSSILMSEGKILPDTINEYPATLDVIVGSVLYKYWEDQEQRERINKLIAEIVDDKWCVSMECIFPHFDYAIVTPNGEQKVVARNEETAFLSKYLKVFGGKGEYKGYRVGRLLRDFTFSGKGIVDNPANPRSKVTDTHMNRAESFYGAAASIQDIGLNQEEKQMSKEIETVAKSEYDSLVEELKALKASAAEQAQKEIDDKIKSISAEVDAHKEIIVQKDSAIASLTEQLTAAKSELETVKKELQTEKLNVVKASRLAKLLEKGVSEDKAKSLAEKFASISEELFTELVDAIPTEAKKSDEDMEKEECAEKAAEAAKALEDAKTKEAAASIPNDKKADDIIAKASAWFKPSVDSSIPQKKSKK